MGDCFSLVHLGANLNLSNKAVLAIYERNKTSSQELRTVLQKSHVKRLRQVPYFTLHKNNIAIVQKEIYEVFLQIIFRHFS